MTPKDFFKRFGMVHGLPVLGFLNVWHAVGEPPLDPLSVAIREHLGELGVTKSAAYRYVASMRQWNADLGREPEQLDALAHEVVMAFLQPEENSVPNSGTCGIVKPA